MAIGTARPIIQAIHAASDPDTALRMALESGMALADAHRGLGALVDRGSGRLVVSAIAGVRAHLGQHLEAPSGGRKDALFAVLRDGRSADLGIIRGESPPLGQLKRLGFDRAVAIPLPSETVVSPCIAAGHCLSAQCLVGERTASASPQREWLRRVAMACRRAESLRAPGLLVLDAPGLPEGESLAELEEIASAVGAAVQGLREGPGPGREPLPPTPLVEEEWMRRAFSAVDDPILVADSEGSILFANRHARRLLFAQPADSEGRRRAVDFNRMLLDAWLRSHIGLPESQRARELSLVDPELGSELLFELLTSTAHNSVTRETGTIVLLKNVSDLRRAMDEFGNTMARLDAEGDELRRERDQLDLVLENIDQPIVVAGPRGTAAEGVLAGGMGSTLRLNRAAKQLLQSARSSDERARETVRRNDAVVSTFLSQAAVADQEAHTEIALTDPQSGQTRTYAARAAVARDRLGASAAIVAALADITELRELERRRLERQLFESEKLAATGRLAASFAHEINNPLEAMKNALYLLAMDGAADVDQKRYLKIASDESERISRIVKLLLGFYRPSVTRTSVDLSGLLQDVVELVTEQLRKARVRTYVTFDTELPKIVASPDQLKQVFLNVMLNALQAMPEGGQIHLRTSAVSGEGLPAFERAIAGEGILVEVRDTGPGVAPDAEAHLFEPFYTTKSTGTGLGLWVCHEIINAHGGSIRITNSPAGGALVRVMLPLAAPAQS